MGFRVRSMRRPGWLWMRSGIIDDYGPQLGAYGIAVYCVLAKCADNDTQEAFPGIEYIAQRINCSGRHVQKMIRLLEELGLIAVETRKTSTGTWDHNVYWLLALGGEPRSPYPEPDSTGSEQGSHELDPCNYIWSQVLIELEMHMGKSAFARWLSGSRVTENGGDTLTVKVRDEPAVQWLSGRWQDIIDEKLSAVAGRDVSVAFV